MFRVRLDNEDIILGYVSGKIRRSFIRILPGDRVKIEVSRYDSTRGHVRGRVVSWSSAGTCGFRGTRRGTPFAAQTAAGNAIRAVVDQGMQRAEVMIKGPGLGRDAALRAIRRSEIVDNTQHIASLTEPVELVIGLQIEKNSGYFIKAPNTFQDGSYPIDPVFMPIQNVNHSIHSYENGNKELELSAVL
ncbi:hypothetical protein L6452_45832 [Arctium lappa]|nr:hypothetical protein L6452_45832 [Arctium lappa]